MTGDVLRFLLDTGKFDDDFEGFGLAHFAGTAFGGTMFYTVKTEVGVLNDFTSPFQGLQCVQHFEQLLPIV